MHGVVMGRIASALLVVLLALAPIGSRAQALDLGEWIPGLKVSPFLSERVEYQSNVFQVPSHSQSDVIFKTIPGFLADYTFGPHSVSAGYRAEILNYVDLTNQDTVNHIAVFLLRLDYPRTLLTLRDDFVRTNDPPGTELTGPVESTTNTLKPEGEYRITSTFSTGVNFTWTHVRFDQRPLATSSTATSTAPAPRCSGSLRPRPTSGSTTPMGGSSSRSPTTGTTPTISSS